MNQIASRQQSKVAEFKAMLRGVMERDFPLPTSVTQEAFTNAAIVAVQDNPKILDCDPSSVFRALRRLGALGLVPDGREAALVPFKTRVGGQYIDACQAMPMVFGLIKSARRSGTVKDIRAHVVYGREVEDGRFRYLAGDDEILEHNPILFGDRGEPVGAYAIAVMTDGEIVREVMTAQEIDRVRRAGASQLVFAKNERPKVSDAPIGIWETWWEEMWKKTVIRRMTKRLDLSAEDRRIITADEDTPMRDVTPEAPPPAAERLPRGTAAKLAALADDAAPGPDQTPDEDVTEDGEIIEHQAQDPAPEAGDRSDGEGPGEADPSPAGEGAKDSSPAPQGRSEAAAADARKRGLEAHRIGMGLKAVPEDLAKEPELSRIWQAAWREADAAKRA